ncbi:acyltransferase [Corynebacterium sp. TAE3-ERU12]|uniref:acyltransferase family protein n=1 Tax=Corynebacterium sp. TAE3-ERU12 TaxID=2849491 RepID=UPI001C47C4AB|nr:acyltransferase [Corynebacterium sp. TAE3-ERU12]MBV7296034.1 acyltransferase [Corynebacterium sp. TAE3-ERU12]
MTAPSPTQPARRTPDHHPAFRPGFLPALEGLRAVASIGIIGTHVAFQTGHDTGALWERLLGRFDFFVAVFFCLSGFLLWRSHRASAGWLTYYRKRCARILPAYWVLVLLVLIAFPVAHENGAPGWDTWLANLTLTQIYVPGGLHGGLTHLWSLAVEVAFYTTLPLFAIALRRINPHTHQLRRIAVITALAVGSFAWSWLPLPYLDGVNPHVQPGAYFSWFTTGMILAELESLAAHPDPRRRALLQRIETWARRRWIWLILAAAALTVAAIIGPEGLVVLDNWEFIRRLACGLVFGVCIVGPWALAPQSRLFATPVMQALGRWSYGIFLWHMAMLSVAFPLLGVPLFSGHIIAITVVTVALTIPAAAASYALVEEPARKALGRHWATATKAKDAAAAA